MGRKSYLHGRVDATRIDDVDIDLEASTQVKEEPVIANREVRADGRIPNISEAFFPFRPVRGYLVCRARKQVGIVRVEWLPRLTLRDTTDSSVDVPIGAFAIVR